MLERLLAIAALTSVTFACTAEDGDLGDAQGPAGGKADDNQAADECGADIVDPRVVVNKRDAEGKQAAWLQCGGFTDEDGDGSGDRYGFVANVCCTDEGPAERNLFDELSATTGCPSKVAAVGNGGTARCANDVEGDDARGQFVPTACCAPLCDGDAKRDAGGLCRASDGTFEDDICCHPAMTTEDRRGQDRDNPDRSGDFGRRVDSSCEWIAFDAPNAIGRSFGCMEDGLFTADSCCMSACAGGALDPDTCKAAAANIAGEVIAKLGCSEQIGDIVGIDDVEVSSCFGVDGPEKDIPDCPALFDSQLGDSVEIETARDLQDKAAEIEALDLDSETLARQLHASLEFLGFGSFATDEEVVDFVDFGGFIVHRLEMQTLDAGIIHLTWIEFGMGDTEVGVVFEHSSATEVVGEVGDQDFFTCFDNR